MKKLFSLWTALTLVMTFSLSMALAAGEAATGEIKDRDGKSLGTATLTQQDNGSVRLQVKYSGLPAGTHGIHFHAAGKCEGPEFTSAGGHFNPDGKKHGLQTPDGGHAGDLPNMVVAAGGSGAFDTTSNRVTLSAGPRQLIGSNGAALVIHAGPDDDRTDPAGNSGARIACAVLNLQPAGAPAAGQGGLLSPEYAGLWGLAAGLALLAGLSLAGLLAARRRATR